MSIFNRKKPQLESKSYYQPLGKASWSDRNYEIFARNAYTKNVIAYRCISLIAKSASTIPLLVYNKKLNSLMPNHLLSKLLNAPNPTQTMSQFFETLYSYKLIAGNCYIQGVFLNDEPKELFLLRPDRITILTDNSTLPIAYRYKVNNHEKTFYVDSITGKSEVLHIKNFSPLDDYYGLSPVESASYSIDQHNEASKWNQAMLQNGARPSGALVVKADKDNSSFLTNEQFDRLKRQINDEFSGGQNAGRPLLLEGGLEWKEMSLTPTDMDFLNTKYSCARDIALAFGVPSQLLGLPGDNTYNNMGEARLSLWEETILPLIDGVVEVLNHWLAPMFGEDIAIYYDKDKISAMSSRQEVYWNKIANADFLSGEEKKKLLDL
jgi:HK97 family phage portal protein